MAAVGRGGGGGEENGRGNNKTVCVTGANGYVAAELVKQLLARGMSILFIHIIEMYGWIGWEMMCASI